MNEEPLSELTKALDNATTKEMLPLERLTKEEQIFSSEELTKQRDYLTRVFGTALANLLMRFMVWLYKKIRMLLIGETALSKTSIDLSTANVDTASAAVSQPSQSVDTASAAVPQPSQSVDTDKVTTTSRNSKADSIRDQEVQAVGEFSHLVEARQKTLEKQREERLRQSKQTHRFAIGALSIGIMLIFIGVVCIFFLPQ